MGLGLRLGLGLPTATPPPPPDPTPHQALKAAWQRKTKEATPEEVRVPAADGWVVRYP